LQGADQVIPLGPAASQIAIKQLGTNGGGFFGVNSAHPFENPTAWSNLFEVASIILIPVALVFTFGHYVKDLRQSRAIIACMLALFLIGGAPLWAEYQPNPALKAPVQQTAPLEGKESRFGTTGSVLWSVTTTAASNGSVNAMHDSLNPLSRHGGAGQHDGRRGDLRRRRRRALRHVAVRADRGVPGRPDDRPHPGIPGQEAAGP
jgi:K+-transporting ATPase ATPase A chain